MTNDPSGRDLLTVRKIAGEFTGDDFAQARTPQGRRAHKQGVKNLRREAHRTLINSPYSSWAEVAWEAGRKLDERHPVAATRRVFRKNPHLARLVRVEGGDRRV